MKVCVRSKCENNRYEFAPAHGVDGPLITWTPERPEGNDLLSHTGSDIKPIDRATILVTPIPDGKDEYTTPLFPVPEERDLNDYILVFPFTRLWFAQYDQHSARHTCDCHKLIDALDGVTAGSVRCR